MKQKNFHIYLTEQERTQVISALIQLKNSLIAQGRYTDAVDDILIKVMKARKKRFAVHADSVSVFFLKATGQRFYSQRGI